MVKTSRAYVLTINYKDWEPSKNDVDLNTFRRLTPSYVAHWIVGFEVAKTGTAHKQIAICFRHRICMKEVKFLFPRAHIEPLRGQYDDAVEYCRKDGNYEEYAFSPEIELFTLINNCTIACLQDATLDNMKKLVYNKRKAEKQTLLLKQKRDERRQIREMNKNLNLYNLRC